MKKKAVTHCANLVFNYELLLLLLFVGTGCQKKLEKIPEGFARFQQESPVLKSISAEGVIFQARWTDGVKGADALFWKTALKRHLSLSGYRLQNEGDIKSKTGLLGGFVESAAPFSDQDMKYLAAYLVKDNELLVIESGGEVRDFERHKISIIKTIEQY